MVLKEKLGMPFSVRLSEVAATSVCAEARITKCSLSEVVRIRIEEAIAQRGSGETYRSLVQRDLRRAMVHAVNVDLSRLREQVAFLESHAKSTCNAQYKSDLEAELNIYVTELNLRNEEQERQVVVKG